MPHIMIKAIGGASKEQMQRAAEEAAEAVSRVLGKPKKYCSASFEEYSFAEWEGVYNEHIKDNDKVVVKPGYTNPKTFQ